MNNICFVTGGAGFIGSNFILQWLREEKSAVVNIDKMTYAGNPSFPEEMAGESRHIHEKVDIADADRVRPLFRDYRPRYVVHFAGESHVDRSIDDPSPFLHTNIAGTYVLLEAAREYYRSLDRFDRHEFRFLHVSTDEVYGSLDFADLGRFTETNRYEPSTPYAATKAASDHLVRSWWKTYYVPTVSVNCSNNYGPRQSPEKLVPKTILNALSGNPVTVYGDGRHVRDWLYVEDCCDAIRTVLLRGRNGESYNVGGRSERNVLDVVGMICDLLEMSDRATDMVPLRELVRFSPDRPGNDRRYALDTDKIETELGWHPGIDFETGMERTVRWYLEHRQWLNEASQRNRTHP